MVFPDSSNESCSESASWIHWRSSIADNTKVSQSDSQADGQWSDEARVWFIFIWNTKNDENKNEAEEKFKSKALICGNMFVQVGVSKTCTDVGWEISDKNVQACSSCGSSSALCDDIKNCANDGNFSSGKKTNGNSRVYVTTRNMPNSL